ncbi:alpha/beta fold hydrolase [Saccharomonospora xinjiangensis]|uniref:alpha/beta fold hydrolase n=1 Tax=Saccharomonospora xinjiangensis TaxID=75294 RepID=UPI00106FFE96|nr:alpha/beta fold hydrolase [Saccharomonospora xinjiangensis]QBQ61322.1 Fluoroacetate dehalogenase [Saccharomonospora xinjiangensis]
MTGLELPERFDTPGGTVRWGRLGQGRPVVLLHGTPFSSWVWRDVATALAERHEVFVWDLLGYGESEQREGQDVSLAAQGEIFASLLGHWDLAAPDVVAHDIGGAVSLRAHLLHGARYRSLALVDVVALRPWGSPFFRLVADHPDVFERLPPPLHEALVREYVAGALHRAAPDAVIDRLVKPWLGSRGQAAFYRQIAQADQRHTDDIEQRFEALDLPVLVCWGEEDAWIPLERGEELARRIPGARLRRIACAAHLVQHDAPAALAGALLGFLG